MAGYRKQIHDEPIPEGHQIYAHCEIAGLVRRKRAARRYVRGRHQRLQIKREPGNRYDPNPVRVIGHWRGWFRWRTAHLGYVPAGVARLIAELDVFDQLAPRLRKTFEGRAGFLEIDFQLTGPKAGAKRFKDARVALWECESAVRG